MNIKVEDILTRLTAGESVDEIVEKFNSVLNDAIRLDEENKKAAEAAKKAEELKEQKREATKAFVDSIAKILEVYGYEDYIKDFDSTEDIDMWVEAMDETFNQFNSLAAFLPTPKTKQSPKREDPVFKFLKDFDLA